MVVRMLESDAGTVSIPVTIHAEDERGDSVLFSAIFAAWLIAAAFVAAVLVQKVLGITL